MRAKIVLALVGAAAAAVVGLFAPVGPVVVAGAGYAGFIAPTLRAERAAASQRSDADRALVALVEWAEALDSRERSGRRFDRSRDGRRRTVLCPRSAALSSACT